MNGSLNRTGQTVQGPLTQSRNTVIRLYYGKDPVLPRISDNIRLYIGDAHLIHLAVSIQCKGKVTQRLAHVAGGAG